MWSECQNAVEVDVVSAEEERGGHMEEKNTIRGGGGGELWCHCGRKSSNEAERVFLFPSAVGLNLFDLFK